MTESKNIFLIFSLMCLILTVNCNEKSKKQEIWEQDLTDSFKIEGTDQGLQKVNLKCGAESMLVQLETEKDFTGVMYTRGSFHKQSAPCFMKPNIGRGSRSLEMRFNFDQCQTQKEGETYSNIVVIQNDPELVTPGDSAFSLECDFRKPREHQVQSGFQAKDRKATSSKITLTSPDPSAVEDLNSAFSVQNNSDSVTYVPNKTKTKIKIFGTVEDVPITLAKPDNNIKDEL